MENWIRLDTGERKSGCSVSKDEDEEGAFVSMGVNTLSFKSLTRGITNLQAMSDIIGTPEDEDIVRGVRN